MLHITLSSAFLSATVGRIPLNYVSECTYLGHTITDKLSDDADIKGQNASVLS